MASVEQNSNFVTGARIAVLLCTKTTQKIYLFCSTEISHENLIRTRNSLFRDYKMVFFFVRCIIPLFHPPIGVYTRYFSTLGAIMDFSPRDIIHMDYYTAAVLEPVYFSQFR